MNLWNAIALMRRLSSEGKPFSFKHYTWDRDRQKANGLRIVHHALLRPAAKGDDLRDADHKLFYTDLDIPEMKKNKRNCWQILIVEFNGMKLTPKQVFYESVPTGFRGGH